MVTIGGGYYRGRKIEVPSYLEVPTKSIVRLGVANALSMYLDDASVLDLFAGSGAVGIELLSRGAKSCVFCDKESEAISVISKNLNSLHIDNSIVMQGDYRVNLDKLIKQDKRFSIVFVDPPYHDKEAYEYCWSLLKDEELLLNDGIVVMEYEGNIPVMNDGYFARSRTYRYGRTSVTIFWRQLLI